MVWTMNNDDDDYVCDDDENGRHLRYHTLSG